MTQRRSSFVLLALLAAIASPLFAAAKKPPAVPRALSELTPVSDCGSCETWPPFLQAISGDEALIAWRGLHDDLRMELDRFGVDGERLGRVSSLSTPSFLRILGSAADGDGWVTAWTNNNREILYRRLSDGAAAPVTINPQLPVGSTTSSAGFTAAPDGSLWFSWHEVANQQGVSPLIVERRDRDGGPLTPPTTFAESYGSIGAGFCFRPDGSAIAVWTPQGEPPRAAGFTPVGVAIRRLDAAGTPIADPILLSAPPDQATQAPSPAVVCTPDGGYAVVWTTDQPPARDGYDVVWQRFDKKHKALGAPQILNSGLGGDQFAARLLRRRDGSWLALWRSSEGDAVRIEGRRFNAKGKASGNEFVLHSGTAATVQGHSILADPAGGRFVLGLWGEGRVGYFQWYSD